MHRKGLCMAKGGMYGEGHAWQERRPLQWTVRILLECILAYTAGFGLGFRFRFGLQTQ